MNGRTDEEYRAASEERDKDEDENEDKERRNKITIPLSFKWIRAPGLYV